MSRKKVKDKIFKVFDYMYANGEWGGEDPQGDFNRLRRLFRRYEDEPKD